MDELDFSNWVFGNNPLFANLANANANPSVSTNNGLDGLNFNNIMQGLDVLSQGIGAYTGLRQLSLAKDQFKFNKGLTRTNLANQAQTINTQLEDRQRARIASNPTAYQSLAEYMNQNRVSGTIGG